MKLKKIKTVKKFKFSKDPNSQLLHQLQLKISKLGRNNLMPVIMPKKRKIKKKPKSRFQEKNGLWESTTLLKNKSKTKKINNQSRRKKVKYKQQPNQKTSCSTTE